MASTIVEVQLPSGLTATLSLYADGSDTLANSGGADTLTEATNRKGLYTATVTEALDGVYFAKVLVGANVVATGWVQMADDTNTYCVVDAKTTELRTALGLASDNLDTQLSTIDGNVDAVLVDTGTTIPATLSTIEGYVDIIDDATSGLAKIAIDVSAVLVDTGTTIPGVLGTPSGADLATDIAAIDTVVDAVLVDTGTTIPAQIAALNDLSAAEVNAEVVDALSTDTYAELAAVPAATSSLKDKITWVFQVSRNKLTQTASTSTLYADDGSTSVATSTVSDDGTTFTKGEYS